MLKKIIYFAVICCFIFFTYISYQLTLGLYYFGDTHNCQHIWQYILLTDIYTIINSLQSLYYFFIYLAMFSGAYKFITKEFKKVRIHNIIINTIYYIWGIYIYINCSSNQLYGLFKFTYVVNLTFATLNILNSCLPIFIT